jgi:energy-coupling factor transporter ATP-binding protein EcfA2
MKLTSKKYEVSEGEEFGEDILKRRPFGESLCNLVKRSETPLVIGLNGHWGEGKTTFVKMWQGLLSKENIPNVYIDAFENDYLEDAFMVVASSINDYIEKEVGKEKSENFAKIAARVGVQTLSFATKIGIRIASL